MWDLIECPEIGCIAPAEVLDRFVLSSTDGPIEHLKTRCVGRHVLIAPRRSMPRSGPPRRR